VQRTSVKRVCYADITPALLQCTYSYCSHYHYDILLPLLIVIVLHVCTTGDLLRLKEVETGVIRALKEVSSDEGAGSRLYEHRLEFLSEVSILTVHTNCTY
jgi:hypothetical protein